MPRKPKDHTAEYTNYFVDVDGTTYRVALHRGGHPLIVCRRSYGRAGDYDIGQPLVLTGAKAKRAILAALKQRSNDIEEDLAAQRLANQP